MSLLLLFKSAGAVSSASVYLSTDAADAGVTAGSGTKKKAQLTTPAGSNTQVVKETVAGPTAPLQVTDGTGTTDGTAISWYTTQLEAQTIAGAVSWSFWTQESASNKNVALTIRVERCSSDGTVQSTIVAETVNQGAGEAPTTAATDSGTIAAGSVTDTTLTAGDRLRVTLWIDDAASQGGTGNMGSAGWGKAFYGAGSSQGLASVTFAEVLTEYTPPSGTSGTLDASFGGLTATVAGTPTKLGVLAANFGALTATVVGLRIVGGVLAAPFGSLAATVAGTRTTAGTVQASFGGLTATIAGAPVRFGVLTATFGGLTATAVGTPSKPGVLAAAFGGLTATAAGTKTVGGVLAAPFGSLTATVVGLRTVHATAVASFGSLTATITGTRTTAGTATAAFGGLTATLAGGRLVPGVLTATFGPLTATVAGLVTRAGTAVAAFGTLTATVAGVRAVHGVLAANLGPLTATAAGVRTTAGTLAAPFGGLAATIGGTPTVGGVLTSAFGPLTATAVGSRTVHGTLAAPFGALAAHALGTVTAGGITPPSPPRPIGGTEVTFAGAHRRRIRGRLHADLNRFRAHAHGTAIPVTRPRQQMEDDLVLAGFFD